MMPLEENVVRSNTWAKEWAMRCIQNALLAHMDTLWAKATQDQQLVNTPFSFFGLISTHVMCCLSSPLSRVKFFETLCRLGCVMHQVNQSNCHATPPNLLQKYRTVRQIFPERFHWLLLPCIHILLWFLILSHTRWVVLDHATLKSVSMHWKTDPPTPRWTQFLAPLERNYETKLFFDTFEGQLSAFSSSLV